MSLQGTDIVSAPVQNHQQDLSDSLSVYSSPELLTKSFCVKMNSATCQQPIPGRFSSNKHMTVFLKRSTVLILLIQVTNFLKIEHRKNTYYLTETLAYWYSYDSTQQGLSDEYQHDMVWIALNILGALCLEQN